MIDTLTEVRTTKNTVRRAQYTQIEVSDRQIDRQID